MAAPEMKRYCYYCEMEVPRTEAEEVEIETIEGRTVHVCICRSCGLTLQLHSRRDRRSVPRHNRVD